MSTTDNNKLLAEFMGKKELITESQFLAMEHKAHNPTIIEYLRYDTDWNWLMQVVEKIEDIESIDVDILSHGTRIYEWRSGGRVIADNCADISFNKKIEHTYDSVIKFVKWYNLNK